VIARALGSGRVKLNEERETSIEEAVSRIHEVMSYRAEKVIYVEAVTGASWAEFLEFVDHI
jgi:hypothetical protein